MAELNSIQRECLTYLETHDIADLNDKLLPANLRQALLDVDSVAAVRVQDEYQHYHLILLTANQAYVASAAGMTLQQYAELKVRYGK